MLGLLMDGGWMMLPLLLCSILGLAVIIDRMRAFKASGGDYELMRKTIRGKLEEGDVMAALETASAAKGPVAATLLTGLNRFVRLMGKGKGADEAAAAAVRSMEEYAPKALKPLENRLNLLVLVAAIAPLLGMTGTVTGMISSFDVMASSAGCGRRRYWRGADYHGGGIDCRDALRGVLQPFHAQDRRHYRVD